MMVLNRLISAVHEWRLLDPKPAVQLRESDWQLIAVVGRSVMASTAYSGHACWHQNSDLGKYSELVDERTGKSDAGWAPYTCIRPKGDLGPTLYILRHRSKVGSYVITPRLPIPA